MCVCYSKEGGVRAVSMGECAAALCTSEEVGFQQSVCEYLFVCGCACVEQRAPHSEQRWGGGGYAVQ